MDNPVSRGTEFLEDARDPSLDSETRYAVLDRVRCCLIDARRARMPPEQVVPLLIQVLETCGTDGNPHARALVGQIAEDLCMRELRSYCIPCTGALQRALSDEHVLVVKRIIRTLTVLFRKVTGLVVSTGVGVGLFPDDAFSAWRNMQNRAVAAMESNDPGIQKAATKFAETAVLALSYSGGRPTPEHFTLDYAALRRLGHPMLIIDDLEAEGKRIVTLVTALIYGSFGIPPPTGLSPPLRVAHSSLITAFSVIGNLIKRRGKLLRLTMPALLVAVDGIRNQSEAFMKFSEGQRWALIKMLKSTLKMVLAFPYIAADHNVVNAQADIRRIDDKLKHENHARSHRSRSSRHDPNRERIPRNAVPGHQTPEQPGAMKRPRASSGKLQLVPPPIAWDYSQYFINQMPPNEVAHFVMTRLILDTPPLPSQQAQVQPEQKYDRRASKRTKTEADVPAVEVPRRPVRRHAPPVVKLQLSEEGIDRLYHRCCKSLLMREAVAKASGAEALRRIVLSGLLARVALKTTEAAGKLCKEVVNYIADNVEERRELALTWLHFVLNTYDENRVEKDETRNTVIDTLVVKTEVSVANDANDANSNPEAQDSEEKTKTETELVETPRENAKDAVDGRVDAQMKNVEPNPVSPEPNGKAIDGTTDTGNGIAGADTMEVELFEQIVDEPGGYLTKCDAYMRLFRTLIDELIARPNIDNTHVRRMIVDAPIIPSSVMEMLREACRDVERAEFALAALRDIILERSGKDRSEALEAVLELAVDKDDVIRGPTIRLVAGTLYSELAPSARGRIEAFAFDGLSLSIANLEDSNEENRAELLHRSWLVTALCSQKHALVHRLADAYVGAGPAARDVLLDRAKLLSGQLGAEAPAIVQLIGNGANGGEEFAIAFLGGVVKKYGRPAAVLVDAGCTRFSTTGDARFLEAVVTGMTRDQLVTHLEDLVKYCAKDAALDTPNATSVAVDAEEATAASKPYAKLWRTVMEAQPPALNAPDLLVALHSLEDTAGTRAAIRACFELRAIYKHAVVAQALQTLVGQAALSPVLMRTVLLMRGFYENVDEYLGETIVVPLIRRKLWTTEELWKGFLDYCQAVKEKCVKILLRLPAPQLEDALKKRTELVENFRPLMSNPRTAKKIPVTKRRVVANALKTAGQT